MATRWPPPGLPFPFPPQPPQQPPHPDQQHQQQSHPDAQSRPADAYQQHPPPTNFAPPPPTWTIPGLNFQPNATAQSPQSAQTPQPPQFPPAWPAPFPTPEQWNHMQLDMQQLPYMMMQGAPIPGLNFASNPPNQAPFHNAAPGNALPTPPANPFLPSYAPPKQQPAQPAQPAQQSLPPLNERVVDIADSDKEDGEVSEGDRMTQSRAATGRTYPVPPRSAPVETTQDAYNPNQPAAGQAVKSASQHKPVDAADPRAEAKKFIKLLHTNNVGYHALAAEDLDSSFLRDLYRSLNLPSEPEPVPAIPQPNGTALPHLSNEHNKDAPVEVPSSKDTRPITTINTGVPPAPPNKSAASPAGDRKEYIARLQAAKMAKNAAAKATPPQKLSPLAPSAPSAALQLTEAEKKARTTELIRQRIEALKKNSASPAAAAPPSNPPNTGTTHDASPYNQPEVVPQASPAVSAPFAHPTPASPYGDSPAQSIPASPYGNIPGLFMNPPSMQTPINKKRTLPFDGPIEDSPSFSRAGSISGPNLTNSGPQSVDSFNIDGNHESRLTSTSSAVPVEKGQQDVRRPPITHPLPPRPTSIHQSTSTTSTPGPQTPSSSARSQELEDKERKMAALKERLQKKMEAMEEQKRQAQQKALALAAKNEEEPSSQPQSGMPVRTLVSSQPEKQHTAAQSTRNTGDEEIQRAPKRRRKEEIEAQLPTLDAEIAENAVRLARITKELELLTATDAKIRQDKARLQQELESLGIDTEGMPHAELQAKKAEIVRDQEATLGNLSVNVIQTPARTNQSIGSLQQTSLPGLSPQISQSLGSADSMKIRSSIDGQSSKRNNVRATVGSAPALNGSKVFNGSKAMPHLSDVSETATPAADEEDFYSPEPDTIMVQERQSDALAAPGSDATSLSEEGEIAMSESEEEGEEEEDYEPEEAHAPAEYSQLVAVNDPEQPSTVVSTTASTHEDADEDNYEPPDIDQPMLDSDSNAPGIEADEEEMDISSDDDSDSDSDSDESSDSSDDDDYPNDATPQPSGRNVGLPSKATDNVAPESMPQITEVPAITETAADLDNDTNPRLFVPYESPLKVFKSYRYHPNYAQDVNGGFLSMTFSHQIDPHNPLCANEALGLVCNDENCHDQHFRSMQITGEQLLVELGTANPGKTPEERQRWNDGLRSVLKVLRQKNSKDPHSIAMEIANFRRQFLKDDTRVVNL